MRRLTRISAALGAWLVLTAAAADPADRLKDPAQEARARALFRDVRCLVCQSESIDESDATLAHDLRQLVRQEIAQGRSDDQIRAFLVSRYGEFVLLTPKATLANAVLWAGPLAVVLGGVVVLLLRRRIRQENDPAPLTEEEEAALKKLNSTETV